MRLFLAVDPDPAARRLLSEHLSTLRAALGDASSVVRWTRPENVHVTLHFLGEVGSDRVDDLRRALGGEVGVGRFDLATGGFGAFPARGIPRTLWLAIETGRDRLVDLHRQLAHRLAAAAAPVSDKPLAAHVTFGRVRDRARHRAAGIPDVLARLDAEPIHWTVDRVTLYASDLSGPAPRYQPVHVIHL